MEVVILFPIETYDTCNFPRVGESPDPIQKSRESVETIDSPKYTIVQ